MVPGKVWRVTYQVVNQTPFRYEVFFSAFITKIKLIINSRYRIELSKDYIVRIITVILPFKYDEKKVRNCV